LKLFRKPAATYNRSGASATTASNTHGPITCMRTGCPLKA